MAAAVRLASNSPSCTGHAAGQFLESFLPRSFESHRALDSKLAREASRLSILLVMEPAVRCRVAASACTSGGALWMLAPP